MQLRWQQQRWQCQAECHSPALLTELRDGTRQPKPLLSTRFAPLRVSLTRQNPRGVCRNARPSPAPLPARRCLHAATPRGPNTGRPPAPSAQPCPGTARRRGDRPLTQRSHRPARPTGAARSAASCPRPSAGTAWSPCCHVPRLSLVCSGLRGTVAAVCSARPTGPLSQPAVCVGLEGEWGTSVGCVPVGHSPASVPAFGWEKSVSKAPVCLQDAAIPAGPRSAAALLLALKLVPASDPKPQTPHGDCCHPELHGQTWAQLSQRPTCSRLPRTATPRQSCCLSTAVSAPRSPGPPWAGSGFG